MSVCILFRFFFYTFVQPHSFQVFVGKGVAELKQPLYFLKILVRSVVCSCFIREYEKINTFCICSDQDAEVIGLKGTLKWTQGEELLLCLLQLPMLMSLNVCQTWIHEECNEKSIITSLIFLQQCSINAFFRLMNFACPGTYIYIGI